jgi:hypothetical protein
MFKMSKDYGGCGDGVRLSYSKLYCTCMCYLPVTLITVAQRRVPQMAVGLLTPVFWILILIRTHRIRKFLGLHWSVSVIICTNLNLDPDPSIIK